MEMTDNQEKLNIILCLKNILIGYQIVIIYEPIYINWSRIKYLNKSVDKNLQNFIQSK